MFPSIAREFTPVKFWEGLLRDSLSDRYFSVRVNGLNNIIESGEPNTFRHVDGNISQSISEDGVRLDGVNDVLSVKADELFQVLSAWNDIEHVFESGKFSSDSNSARNASSNSSNVFI